MTRTITTTDELAARWFRVSSDGQDEQNQVTEVDGHIAARGYGVARTFTLHDVSASKGEQAGELAEVVADIRNGAYSVVVVAHSSRLDRREDLDAQLAFVMAVRAAGGRVESVREPQFGKTDLTGRLVTLVAQYGNAEYSRALREHIGAAKARIAANGAVASKPAWGFATEGERYSRRLVATDEAREYVPQIYARVIAGESLATVARWLESEHVQPAGIKSTRNGKGKSGKWWPRSLAALVRNPVYAGRRVDAAGQTITTCEPLVSWDVWTAAGKRLDAKPKRGPIVKTNRAYLSGAAKCARCGSPCYRINCGSAYYLRCTGRGADRHGCGLMVRLATAESLTDGYLAGRPDLEYEITTIPGNGAELDAQLAAIDFERQQLARRGLSWDEEDAERARLRAAWNEISATERTPDRRERTATGRTTGAVWQAMDVNERADWLRSAVTVYVAKGEHADADAVADGVSVFAVWAGTYDPRDLPASA